MRDIQVLVVDDHRVFSDAVRLVLGGRPGIGSVDTVTSGEEAVERCRSARPDVVLLDLSLPGMDGIEATRRILGVSPDTRVVVVTALGEDEAVEGSLRAGACGVVSKTQSPEDLVDVVRRAAAGEALSPVGPSRGVHATRGDGGPPGVSSLTERELEILGGIAEGRSTRELARALGISPLTVESHLKSIYAKLGAHSRIEAITAAWRQGLMADSRTA